MKQEMLGVEAVALRLGITERHVRNLAKKHPACEKVGRDWIIPASAIPSLLVKNGKRRKAVVK